MSDGLAPGTLVGQRFAIERIAGSGGMGTVFRARDYTSGEWVALKVMHQLGTAPRDEHRFLREVQVLAELRHPGIVSYVAHGQTERGQPYLAMQWLDGEDLGQRLRRSGLSLFESLGLVQKVAAALAVTHRQGIVHRDLKPSNLFLPGGDVTRVTMLDFGIARRTVGRGGARPVAGTLALPPPLTQTGMVVGTPEYMSPEQARGQHDIGPAADVFSLGCVLFECLTGQPPFAGEHIAAVLAKILFDDAPRLRTLRAVLPEALEELLLRMLNRDREQRLGDAQAVLDTLSVLGDLADLDPPNQTRVVVQPLTLQGGEQQLVSVVYATDIRDLTAEPTLNPSQDQARQALFQSLRTALFVYGVRAERLADGSLVATVTTSDTQSAATDQAALAARGALLIHEQWPSAMVAISTGRGVLRADLPIGEVVDRAVRLLHAQKDINPLPSIILDATTAGLLDSRFEVTRADLSSYTLHGEHKSLDVARSLLGKPTPCVGREQEMATLQAILAGCIEESQMRPVLVIAPAGVGKSRLRHEFLRGLAKRSADEPLAVLYGRADPTYSGSSYALLGQALRGFLALSQLKTSEEKWQQLHRRIAKRLSPAEAPWVAELIGEIVNLPPPEEPSPRLRGMRLEPLRMLGLLSEALTLYLRAECAVQPVVLVLEDLQWADTLSLQLFETVLRGLQEEPLFVLGLARPEFEERFPRLWQERGRQELRLSPLSRRASERLVKAVLGPKAEPATVTRIVEQAAGNALFLEELIRAAGEGKGSELPDTVLAMLQARIGRLDAESRKVLRSASIFGETFSTAGVRALLGPESHSHVIEACLQQLVQAEILEPSKTLGDSSLSGDRIFAFRHSLLREASYGLLTDAARKLGHQLAAAYLESQSCPDPKIIADHFAAAGEQARALSFYLKAADLAFLRSDIQSALANCARVEFYEPSGEALGRLHALHAQLAFVRNDLRQAAEHTRIALELSPPGSEHWYLSVAYHVIGAVLTGEVGYIATLLEQFDAVTPQKEVYGVFVFAGSLVAIIYSYLGMREAALEILERVQKLVGDFLYQDAFAESSFFRALGIVHRFLGIDPWLPQQHFARALAAAERMQHPRNILANAVDLCMHQASLGQYAQAEPQMRALYQRALQLGEPLTIQTTGVYLAALLLLFEQREKTDEALTICLELRPQMAENQLIYGVLLSVLGHIYIQKEDLKQAIVVLRQSSEIFIQLPGLRPLALANLLQAHLNDKDVAAAQQVADQAEDLLSMLEHAGNFGILLRLGIAEAHLLAGDSAAARSALHAAHSELFRAAEHLPDEPRQRYLYELPKHRRLIALSQEWLE